MSPGYGGVRVAAVAVGVVLVALGLGAVAALFAAPGRVFLVALLVTTGVAFVGGVLAEPVLRRGTARLRCCWSGRDGGRASVVALFERSPGPAGGYPAASCEVGQSDDLCHLPRAEVR